MPTPLRLLLIEDSETDATLLIRRLRQADYDVTATRVETGDELRAALSSREFDFVIADYQLPGFDAPAALRILQQAGVDLPFIVVSGAIGEETAAAVMKAGAHDYLSKNNMARLAPVVARELAEARNRLERERAEREVSRTAKELEAVLHTALDGFWILDEQGRFLEVNVEYCRLIGYSRDELLGMSIRDVDGSMTLDEIEQSIPSVMQAGSARFEVKHRAKDGRLVDFEVSTNYVPEEHRFYTFLRDITDRKHREADRESMVALLRAINSSNDTIELIRAATAFLQKKSGCEAVGIRLNEGGDFPYFETRGFSAEFVRAENSLCAHDALDKPVRDSRGDPVLECMCGDILCGRFDPGEPFFTPTGSFWTNCTSDLSASIPAADRPARSRGRCTAEGYESVALIPLRASGKTIGLMQLNDRRKGRFTPQLIAFLESAADSVAIAVEHRRAQAELLASEDRFRLISKNTTDVIWLLDISSGRFTYISPSVGPLLGYAPQEVANLTAQNIVPPGASAHATELIRSAVAAIAAGDESARTQKHELELLRRDGSTVRTEVAGTLITDASGQTRELVGVTRDISERIQAEEKRAQLEEQLRQAQKLETVGRLAGGRAAALTQQLLAFSRKQVIQPRPIDLNKLVVQMKNMLSRVLGEDIELVTDLDPSLAPAMADLGQFHQVLMNLAVNARDAMPSGGRLTIQTTGIQLDAGVSAVHPDAAPGPYVMLAVSDTGTGMSRETREHIFEPFFTTQDEGRGTGLGLSTVYGIVRQFGGAIWVESEPGRGSKFTVCLPRIEGEAGPELSPPASTDLSGGETILLVEDQAEVRKLAVEVLKGYGYRIVEASGGGEALLAAGRHPGAIHLLLTDVVMPGMTGPELAARIKPLRPKMRVLFMSGYNDSLASRRGMPENEIECVQKPFTPEHLAARVRALLGQARPVAKVLVVDDQEPVRTLFHEILTGAGYDVFLAQDGEQALDMVRRDHLDLVLTDLVMPNREGIETIVAIRKERPGIKIVAVSGAFGGAFLGMAEKLGANATLMKPVTPDHLLATVRRVLD